MDKIKDPNRNTDEIPNHYIGLATVVRHYPRISDGKEVLKLILEFHDDFYSFKDKAIIKNHTDECTVFGNGTNHVEIKKKLKKGDVISVNLAYLFSKYRFHDYIVRDSQLITPASVSNGESDDTLGNWM